MPVMKSLLLLFALAVTSFAKDLPGSERFEKAIAAFEAADAAQAVPKGRHTLPRSLKHPALGFVAGSLQKGQNHQSSLRRGAAE
jgi:hypothetical protein